MRRSRLEKEYQYHIENLKRYYSKRNKDESDDFKAKAWKEAIRRKEAETDKDLMKVIKHVYIIKDYNLSSASGYFLNYEATKARALVRCWFNDLDRYFFEAVRYVR